MFLKKKKNNEILDIVKSTISLNAIAFSQNGAVENNFDIKVKLNLFSELNATTEVKDYEEMLDALFSKKMEKYDIMFYDNIFSTRFGRHLLNLNGTISDELINLYKPGIASKTCLYEDKLVGLPISFDFVVLYTNDKYIDKYNRTIPTTWEELLETSKYILKEEEKHGNTNILAFNGLFNENEFRLNDDYTRNVLMSGEFLFLKYWFIPIPFYKLSALPGGKKGISGSIIGGHNIGINSYISTKNKEASVKVLEFLNSWDVQKEYVINDGVYSGIPSLYDDEDVCAVRDCNFIKSIQLTSRPLEEDYNTYSEKYRKYLLKFLYEDDISAEETLIKINDIKNIYEISFKSYMGLNINNYHLSFLLHNSLYIIISICNYLFMFGYRFVYDLIKSNNEEELFIKQLKENFNKENESSFKSGLSTKSHSIGKSSKLSNKILQYHYQENVNYVSSLTMIANE
ncbi:hypothetical protein PIROE2DRAFT_10116 [Piromyces sp. E2]|nr:hypothetical protein PIROE2DRAFT_10116 [Piromyces sp. E2]|eukprot:OUM63392.1 hypothetical protein PIROE2DRAFT_10116 [Piromyces sp. E2]